MPENGQKTVQGRAADPAPAAATRRVGLLVTLVLGGLTALPPISMDMYLPALPKVTDALRAPAATVQLTLTACLAGMALGHIDADRHWRRRVRDRRTLLLITGPFTTVFDFHPAASGLLALLTVLIRLLGDL